MPAHNFSPNALPLPPVPTTRSNQFFPPPMPTHLPPSPSSSSSSATSLLLAPSMSPIPPPPLNNSLPSDIPPADQIAFLQSQLNQQQHLIRHQQHTIATLTEQLQQAQRTIADLEKNQPPPPPPDIIPEPPSTIPVFARSSQSIYTTPVVQPPRPQTSQRDARQSLLSRDQQSIAAPSSQRAWETPQDPFVFSNHPDSSSKQLTTDGGGHNSITSGVKSPRSYHHDQMAPNVPVHHNSAVLISPRAVQLASAPVATSIHTQQVSHRGETVTVVDPRRLGGLAGAPPTLERTNSLPSPLLRTASLPFLAQASSSSSSPSNPGLFPFLDNPSPPQNDSDQDYLESSVGVETRIHSSTNGGAVEYQQDKSVSHKTIPTIIPGKIPSATDHYHPHTNHHSIHYVLSSPRAPIHASNPAVVVVPVPKSTSDAYRMTVSPSLAAPHSTSRAKVHPTSPRPHDLSSHDVTSKPYSRRDTILPPSSSMSKLDKQSSLENFHQAATQPTASNATFPDMNDHVQLLRRSSLPNLQAEPMPLGYALSTTVPAPNLKKHNTTTMTFTIPTFSPTAEEQVVQDVIAQRRSSVVSIDISDSQDVAAVLSVKNAPSVASHASHAPSHAPSSAAAAAAAAASTTGTTTATAQLASMRRRVSIPSLTQHGTGSLPRPLTSRHRVGDSAEFLSKTSTIPHTIPQTHGSSQRPRSTTSSASQRHLHQHPSVHHQNQHEGQHPPQPQPQLLRSGGGATDSAPRGAQQSSTHVRHDLFVSLHEDDASDVEQPQQDDDQPSPPAAAESVKHHKNGHQLDDHPVRNVVTSPRMNDPTPHASSRSTSASSVLVTGRVTERRNPALSVVSIASGQRHEDGGDDYYQLSTTGLSCVSKQQQHPQKDSSEQNRYFSFDNAIPPPPPLSPPHQQPPIPSSPTSSTASVPPKSPRSRDLAIAGRCIAPASFQGGNAHINIAAARRSSRHHVELDLGR